MAVPDKTLILRDYIRAPSRLASGKRSRTLPVNLHQCPTVALALVSELTYQFSATSITNRKSEFMVFNHVFGSQVFNYYRFADGVAVALEALVSGD